MAKLNELQLKNEIINEGPDDLAGLPEQIGGQFPDPPQPGPFRVRFSQPGPISESWDVFDTERGQRIVAKLQDSAALTIIQSPAGRYNGETLDTRISNAERKRGKGPELASDMDYVLQVTKFPGKKPKFGDNRGYAEAFLHAAGKEIGIDWEYSWYCNPKKPVRIDDPNNGIQVMDGEEGRQKLLGCGTRYYMKDVPKEPNEKGEMIYPIRIQCQCGALVRAFGQIARFRE
jgi:hypothetical protein